MSYYRCGSGAGSGTGQYYVAKVGTGAGTYNISSKYNNYKSLTSNNFIVECVAQGGANANSYNDGWSLGHGVGTNSSTTVSKNYNPSNGILTVQETQSTAWNNEASIGGYAKATPANIYLVVGL